MYKRKLDSSLPVSSEDKRRDNMYILIGRISFNRKKKTQNIGVAERGCEISICGDLKNLTGHGPEQPDVGHPD